MNVLRVEEMSNLESILRENPEMIIRDYKRFKRYEVTYLIKATKLPIYTFNYAIKICERRHLPKSELIRMLCEEFNIPEKEAENRLREVKKINKYESEKQNTLKLQ